MTSRHRRLALAGLAAALLLAAFLAWRAATDRSPPSPTPHSSEEALEELRLGNGRFISCRRVLSVDTAHDARWRHETAKEHHPFAAVLCCADSRVCPEFIFDQRLGSLFEIRNAGNVVDDDVMGSFEYAIEHLHVPLLVVLGHKNCGAVHAVCEAGGKPLHAHLRALQDHMSGIRAGVEKARGQHDHRVRDGLAKENARQQALSLLRESPLIATAVRAGQVRLVFALYDMETGEVEFFDLA